MASLPGNANGTVGSGSGSPTSSADQSATGNNQISLTSSPHHGGHTSTQENENTQQTKKGRGATQILKFPINREDLYPAYMVFHPYKIDTGLLDAALGEVFNAPLVADFVEGKTSESVNDTVGGYDAVGTGAVTNPAKKQTIEVEQAQKEANRDQINKEIEDNRAQMGSKHTDLRAYRDLENPAIQLFFPPQLQYNDAVNYNSANLGGAGATATAIVNQGGSILGALGAGLSEGIESIFNLATGSVSAEAAKVGLARISKKLPGGTANAVSSMLQTGLNPGTRLLFDQPAMRSFAFSFKLIPTSSQEAITIKEIIKNFRFQMYPREIDVSPGVPIGYEFPNIYRIEFGFTGASNLQIPKIQYCYLKDVQAAYNSTSGGVFFEDGHPTEIDLNLTFLEYRALSKRDIEAGF